MTQMRKTLESMALAAEAERLYPMHDQADALNAIDWVAKQSGANSADQIAAIIELLDTYDAQD